MAGAAGAALVALGASGCVRAAPVPSRTPPASSAAPARETAPPVTVLLVVDQLAAWVLAERIDTLPDDGGFARLRREGTYVREARYAHAVTDTAPGHAALFTGAPARASGVFTNEVVDDATGKRVSILRDTATKLVTEVGTVDAPGASAARLDVPTIADRVREAHDDAVIVSLSLKDRGAIPGGGRRPSATLWLDPVAGGFVTSTAFARKLPAWAIAAGGSAAVNRFATETWSPLDAAWLGAHAQTPDDARGEGDYDGLGVVFPHRARGTTSPLATLRATPFADEALASLAVAALDGEEARRHPTLLTVSFSANDYVGHVFGPASWESWDELRRLDATLARLFAALDARFGAYGWSAILSADHGVAPLPETAGDPRARPWCATANGANDRWNRPCTAGTRVLPTALAEEMRAVGRAATGDPGLVAGVADPYVFLTKRALALPEAARAKLLDALTQALRARPEVASVTRASELPVTCPPGADESTAALVCRAFARDPAAALYVVLQPGSFFDPEYTPGKGTSHGSPYRFDRAVPILARAPGRIPAGRVVDSPVPIATYARTATRLLAVAPLDEARDGIDLTAP